MTELNNTLGISVEKYEYLINNIADVIVEIDLNGIFTFISPQVHKMFGYKPEEIMGRKLFSYIHPDDRNSLIETFEKAIESKNLNSIELRVRHKEGDYINVLTNGTLLKIDGILKIICVLKDITEKKLSEQKLKKSEEKFKFLYENAPLGYQSLDGDGNILDVNKAWLDFFEYSKEEILGKWFGDFLSQESQDLLIKNFPILRKNGEIHDIEYKVIKKNGTYAFISIDGKCDYDDKGNFTQTHCIFRDITEQKRTDLQLEKERKRAESYLDLAGVIIIALNRDGEITLINKKGYEVLEFEEGELIGKNWFLSCLPPSMKNEVFDVFRKLIKGEIEAVEFYENSVLTKNGKERIIAWHNTILHDDDGNIIGVLSSGEDITERKKVENNLRESEEKYRLLFDKSPDFIYVTDIEGKILDANQVLLDRVELSLQEYRELNSLDFFVGENYDELMEVMNSIRNGNEVRALETRVKNPKGEISEYEINCVPLFEDGTMKKVLNLVRDITERKKVERKLKEINQLKSELLERTSHELKTPLISIKGFTDLLLDLHKEKFDAETVSILDEVKQGTEQLETIINKLLETSHLASGKLDFKPTQDDLSFLIKFCVKSLRGLANTRKHYISLDIPGNIIAKFEKEKLYEVVSNLIINAIKYTPPYGEIKIQSKIRDDFVIVSVEDNGIGLTENEQKKIFKQFGKIERYGQGWDIGIEGTGMGLYTSKKIVELHGGKIWVESEGRNMGSTFCFSLPYSKE